MCVCLAKEWSFQTHIYEELLGNKGPQNVRCNRRHKEGFPDTTETSSQLSDTLLNKNIFTI